MIEAVIFDMDGLLIDSEPLWREAIIDSFEKVGISLTEKMCLETMGRRVDQVIDYWSYKFSVEIEDKQKFIDDLMEDVISLIIEKGKEREGVFEILNFFKSKKIKMGLASSSQMTLINAVTQKLQIRNYFEKIYSAEEEEHGKPHPGVYMTIAEILGTVPEKCLAFEDSFSGLLSAKAARMKCVCVPDEFIQGSPKLAIADFILPSLKDFKEKNWEDLNRE